MYGKVGIIELKLFKKEYDLNDDIRLDIKFDITMLNNIIGYLYKDSVVVTRKALHNAEKLFSRLNMGIYKMQPQLLHRIDFIKKTLEAKLKHGFESHEMIINHCRPAVENSIVETIISSLPIYTKLNYNELKSISKAIEDRLKFLYILQYKDSFFETIERIESGDYNTYKEINDEMFDLCTSYINSSRKAVSLETDNRLSLMDDDFDDKVTAMVNNAKDPSRIIRTGIQALNAMLTEGYQSKRLYTYMGLPSGFKSGILLKSVVDAKLYNPDLKSRKDGKIPTALLVTMENYLEETVERLFNMVGEGADIREFTPKQVIRILREQGRMKVADDNKIDIVIQYVPNKSITTQDLYVMIEDLEDDNRDVIMLVLDYIKRINPALRAKDEKEELKNVTNELKSLAIEKNIVVVTAHQLNREAARAVDAAMQSNKSDLARYTGRSNVGSAWEVMENSDCCIIINKERKRGTNQEFLTFMIVKRRYRASDNKVDYFNHPFYEGNTMRLIDDIGMDVSVSETSLQSEFVDSSDEFKRTSITPREEMKTPTASLYDINEVFAKAV